jgi:hypothetical protein
VLRTLYDAGHYVTAMTEATQQRTEWRKAADLLIMASQVTGQSCLPTLPCGGAARGQIRTDAAAAAQTGTQVSDRPLILRWLCRS